MTTNEHASILIVEDHPALAETVGDYLEAKGYQVDFAADGVLAMQLATTEHFDAIVLDVMLPRLNGIEVCRRLRQEA
ncbi:MAG: response regulator, partial [Pseudomonadales bacterium]